MSIARQFGLQESGKKAAVKTAPEPEAKPAKPLDVQRADEFFSKEAKKRPYTSPVFEKKRKVTSIRIQEEVFDALQKHGVSVSDRANELLTEDAIKNGWL